MKDINLPPNKYDTSEIVMFLSQGAMHNGFYNDDLEFIQLEHVQIVTTTSSSNALQETIEADIRALRFFGNGQPFRLTKGTEQWSGTSWT